MINYVKEAYSELVHKVSWPAFKELQSSTILVMVASLCFAIVILTMDLAFETLMKTVYRLLY
jgi:preprotein translocase subunit SecE